MIVSAIPCQPVHSTRQMISKKVIRQIITESLQQVVDDLKINKVSKRTGKLLTKASKGLATQLRKELKDIAKAERVKEKKEARKSKAIKKEKRSKKKVVVA